MGVLEQQGLVEEKERPKECEGTARGIDQDKEIERLVEARVEVSV